MECPHRSQIGSSENIVVRNVMVLVRVPLTATVLAIYEMHGETDENGCVLRLDRKGGCPGGCHFIPYQRELKVGIGILVEPWKSIAKVIGDRGVMSWLWKWQWFFLGVAVTLGALSITSRTFGGLRHVPPLKELPGVAITNFLDSLPDSVVSSKLWQYSGIERLETWLDNYECPADHEYRTEILHHEPIIFRLRGFLPHGEGSHLLKLA